MLRCQNERKALGLERSARKSKRFRGPARLSAAVNRVVMFAMMGELAVSAL